MKPMILAVLVLFGSATLGSAADTSRDATATAYEHLAKVILEVKAAELSLVESILLDHYFAASHQLEVAKSGKDVAKHVEAAATEITNIANEGDKAILAIRQKLVEGGHHHHHHHSDAESEMDYVFVDAQEKKALLDLAGKVGRLGAKATPEAITPLLAELKTTFDAAIAEEN